MDREDESAEMHTDQERLSGLSPSPTRFITILLYTYLSAFDSCGPLRDKKVTVEGRGETNDWNSANLPGTRSSKGSRGYLKAFLEPEDLKRELRGTTRGIEREGDAARASAEMRGSSRRCSAAILSLFSRLLGGEASWVESWR
eukprot:603923-Amorphochlora_amoeboformis.AAC.1